MTPPLPPANLNARSPRLLKVTAGAVLHRFYNKAHSPIYFDASGAGRLNAPTGAYGVLYSAGMPHGAFAETFLRQPGRQQIPTDLLSRKAYAALEATRDLTFVRLTGPGLAPLGATAEVTHGGLPYDASQAWSKALHGHPSGADGIAYTARHDESELCYAIFDRAKSAIVEIERRTSLDAAWFWDLADHYDVGIASGKAIRPSA